MIYSIKDVSKITGLTDHTIRYYEKIGLLPYVTRNKNGVREFTEDDVFWIDIIKCLKNTGMPINHIKSIVDLSLEGEHTSCQRKSILIEHRDKILFQIKELQNNLEKIDLKIAWYEGHETKCK